MPWTVKVTVTTELSTHHAMIMPSSLFTACSTEPRPSATEKYKRQRANVLTSLVQAFLGSMTQYDRLQTYTLTMYWRVRPWRRNDIGSEIYITSIVRPLSTGN